MSNKERAILIIVICAILAVLMIILTPIGRSMWNKRMHDVQVADDSTNYETLKKVEDACRAMIASYESDRLTYEQYRDSDDSEERSWATQARMRANRTASTYNNYILENSYVWSNNIPENIDVKLDYIEELYY